MNSKAVRAILLICLPLMVLQCSSDKPTTPSLGKLDEPFMLEPGQSITLGTEAIEVVFDRSLCDYRCPLEGECHAGDIAEISVRLTVPGIQPVFVNLAITSDPTPELIEALAVDTLGFRVRLIELGSNSAGKDARAQLEVSKSTIVVGHGIDSISVTDLSPERLNRLPIEINEAAVKLDTLLVKVAYVGGCGIHLIRANANPSEFRDGEVPAVDIYLSHLSGLEACSTAVIRDLKFTLAPIRRAIADRYGSVRPTQLNILGYKGPESIDSNKVYYLASPEWLNSAPILAVPDSQFVVAGETLELHVSATDPDLTIPTLSAGGLPQRAEFSDLGNGRGLFTYSPDSTDVGYHTVTFIASDGIEADTQSVTVRVVAKNHPPELYFAEFSSVFEGDSLFLQVRATDPDGSATWISASNLPRSSTFQDHGDGTATFAFRPDYSQTGEYTVDLTCSDYYTVVEGSFTVWVFDVNRAPEIVAPDSLVVPLDRDLQLEVRATDADLDTISFVAVSVPSYVQFTDEGRGTALIRVFATAIDPTSSEIVFAASDGNKADTARIHLVVATEYSGPYFELLPEQTVVEGDTLRFELQAHSEIDTDPEITKAYSSYAPPWGRSELTQLGNGRIRYAYAPGYSDAGVKTFRFRAWDGTLEGLIDVPVTVLEAGNQQPRFFSPPQFLGATVNQPFVFDILAEDPDDNALDLRATPLPPGATFDVISPNLGRLSFTPASSQLGTFAVHFVAMDDNGAVATHDLSILIDSMRSTSGEIMPGGNGNYWVYQHLYRGYSSMPGFAHLNEIFNTGGRIDQSWTDSTEVVDQVREGDRIWNILSPVIEPLGARFSQQNDTLTFLPGSKWQKYMFLQFHVDTTLTWIKIRRVSITTPVGSFSNAWEYSWTPYGVYGHDFVVTFVEGVGIVEAQEHSYPTSPMLCEHYGCSSTTHILRLIRYRVVGDSSP